MALPAGHMDEVLEKDWQEEIEFQRREKRRSKVEKELRKWTATFYPRRMAKNQAHTEIREFVDAFPVEPLYTGQFTTAHSAVTREDLGAAARSFQPEPPFTRFGDKTFDAITPSSAGSNGSGNFDFDPEFRPPDYEEWADQIIRHDRAVKEAEDAARAEAAKKAANKAAKKAAKMADQLKAKLQALAIDDDDEWFGAEDDD